MELLCESIALKQSRVGFMFIADNKFPIIPNTRKAERVSIYPWNSGKDEDSSTTLPMAGGRRESRM